jgi:hypothetical protein
MDWITRLTARSLQLAPVVQPRLASLFDPATFNPATFDPVTSFVAELPIASTASTESMVLSPKALAEPEAAIAQSAPPALAQPSTSILSEAAPTLRSPPPLVSPQQVAPPLTHLPRLMPKANVRQAISPPSASSITARENETIQKPVTLVPEAAEVEITAIAPALVSLALSPVAALEVPAQGSSSSQTNPFSIASTGDLLMPDISITDMPITDVSMTETVRSTDRASLPIGEDSSSKPRLSSIQPLKSQPELEPEPLIHERLIQERSPLPQPLVNLHSTPAAQEIPQSVQVVTRMVASPDQSSLLPQVMPAIAIPKAAFPPADRSDAQDTSAPPAKPVIRVTIGRIEVRVATSPTPALPRSQPLRPQISLDDYLKSRSGDNR